MCAQPPQRHATGGFLYPWKLQCQAWLPLSPSDLFLLGYIALPVPQTVHGGVALCGFSTHCGPTLGFLGTRLFPTSALKHSLRLSTKMTFSPATSKVSAGGRDFPNPLKLQ